MLKCCYLFGSGSEEDGEIPSPVTECETETRSVDETQGEITLNSVILEKKTCGRCNESKDVGSGYLTGFIDREIVEFGVERIVPHQP